jgi:hypothetical protein
VDSEQTHDEGSTVSPSTQCVQPDYHNVTIKSVPRQGLSTMYCMTNVLKFQQQYLNWQILNWTRVDSEHIKIQLQVRVVPTLDGDSIHSIQV